MRNIKANNKLLFVLFMAFGLVKVLIVVVCIKATYKNLVAKNFEQIFEIKWSDFQERG